MAMPQPEVVPDASTERLKHQAALIRSLCNPAMYGREVERVTVLETHISYVLLTGSYAYKIKKAVDLEFLDFTTLAARHFYCEEELRLNRRLAPSIYLEVVAITGSVDDPAIGGNGPLLEYAVKMREFSQHALLSRMLSRGAVTAAHIDALALKVGAFHGSIQVALADGPFGRPDDILRLALQNFTQIRPLIGDASEGADLDRLCDWTQHEYAARLKLLLGRRRDGFIRECHGDLHLGNIALVDDTIAIFDCIEFNDQMRWGDVMSEVAFAVMDLQDRKRADLASRFLNAYLEVTGDYAGLGVLRFYLAYRAMVRAKIAGFRASQFASGEANTAIVDELRGYVALAKTYTRPPRSAIVITHGVAGSGKTTISGALLELTGAIRIRTDVERKRLYGLSAQARSGSPVGGGLYTTARTEQTYRHACALARHVATAGYIAIVDATFLKRWQRNLFRKLAAELDIPFAIVTCRAGVASLRERVARRSWSDADASEADAAVLEHQLLTAEPLAQDEHAFSLVYDADATLDDSRRLTFCRDVIGRLGIQPPAGNPAVAS